MTAELTSKTRLPNSHERAAYSNDEAGANDSFILWVLDADLHWARHAELLFQALFHRPCRGKPAFAQLGCRHLLTGGRRSRARRYAC